MNAKHNIKLFTLLKSCYGSTLLSITHFFLHIQQTLINASIHLRFLRFLSTRSVEAQYLLLPLALIDSLF